MRVIAGKYRSRTVKAPKTMKIRPTSDKVKGALFNMLEPLEGSSVVDFYSGTGNLGIEAISRGAVEVIFVDKAFESIKLIQENLQVLGIDWKKQQNMVRLLSSEVSKAFYLFYQESKKFDIVIADPPYEKGVLKRIQRLLMEYPILNENGILAIEHDADDTDIEPDFPYPPIRQKKYGDTLLTLFKKSQRIQTDQ